jgi:hypothetical protein
MLILLKIKNRFKVSKMIKRKFSKIKIYICKNLMILDKIWIKAKMTIAFINQKILLMIFKQSQMSYLQFYFKII